METYEEEEEEEVSHFVPVPITPPFFELDLKFKPTILKIEYFFFDFFYKFPKFEGIFFIVKKLTKN